ncbi:hypothetical protein SKAU_G00157530 [Synaphobranchus kaupii]|uniref:Integrase catalytic domain-containing protein n=1 Tax=Synaphobranchus kaupii TaxID=118154 RepID=A0A9Q1FHV3_SYNKA|nr:hypothetical protein SKAU_G00157530 [Synaphobranchus kaupii]
MLDYATRYPEAIPLRTMATKGIARELMLLFSRVGLPEEILTDQGTPFMSRIMRDLCQLIKASTGFSPFELLYGRRPRGLLDLAKEAWEQQPSPHRTMVEHVKEVAVKTEPVQVPMGEQLTPSQRQDLQDLVNRNRDVFSGEAGHTNLIQHRIVTEPGKRMKLRPYRIPEARREAIAAEQRPSRT